MLIVCGSATSWMITNLIDNHGGLHNRITHEMYLAPLSADGPLYLILYAVLPSCFHWYGLLDSSDGQTASEHIVWIGLRAYLYAPYPANQASARHRPDLYRVLFLAQQAIGASCPDRLIDRAGGQFGESLRDKIFADALYHNKRRGYAYS